MPKQTINTLQVYEQKSWSGLTKDNHLGAVFNEQPTLVSGIMSSIWNVRTCRYGCTFHYDGC